MATIINPVLRGFHPDPSVLRVGDTYYLATSTFEWYPGVRIHRSRDLVEWELSASPLDRPSLMELSGVPPSCGIWAPCLSWSKGQFWLAYTVVRSSGRFKDLLNYLTRAPSIEGPWSDPVFLGSSGFDPSFFHDQDGRSWFLAMLADYRPDRNRFKGITIQEFDQVEGRLLGEQRLIFEGTELGKTEGPHLYRHGPYYYLMTAEGGTGLGHAVTVARSPSLFGPYEVDPENPVLSSAEAPKAELQKAGHGCLTEAPDGTPLLFHLCSRPIARRGACPLGRETAVQRMEWTAEGWLRLKGGGRTPRVAVDAPWAAEGARRGPLAIRDDFDGSRLHPAFQTPRLPLGPETASLAARPGYLRLAGGESPASRFRQSLVAVRQAAFRFVAETRLDFAPRSFQQMAGLVYLYDTENMYYLRVSLDERLGRCVGLVSLDRALPEMPGPDVALGDSGEIRLRVEVESDRAAFSYAAGEGEWTRIGPVVDASRLSDERCQRGFEGAFTGAFVGLACHDLSGTAKSADFAHFEYRELAD